jgi:hypothetical protein
MPSCCARLMVAWHWAIRCPRCVANYFCGSIRLFHLFLPGKHPVRRILGLVFLPTIAGLGLMFGAFAFLNWPSSSSVLESTGSVLVHRIHWAQFMLGKLPSRVQFSLIGLLLIAIFTSRLAFGIATLPLALSARHALQAEDSESRRRSQFLIWFLVGIAFLPIVLLSFLTLGVPLLLTSRLPSFVQSDLFPRLSVIPETIVAHATRARPERDAKPQGLSTTN